MQRNLPTLGIAGKHSMALIWGFYFSDLSCQQKLLSYINGDHDRWVNGEDLKFEYVHFTKDGVRGEKLTGSSGPGDTEHKKKLPGDIKYSDPYFLIWNW